MVWPPASCPGLCQRVCGLTGLDPRWLTRDSAPVCPVVGPEGPAKGGGVAHCGVVLRRTKTLPVRRNISIGPIRTTVWPGDGVTGDPGLNAQQGCQAALRWTWDDRVPRCGRILYGHAPTPTRFHDAGRTTMQGRPSPSSRTTRASTWFLGHTAIPPLPHSHALEPESPSGNEPLSRIRACHSSVDMMFRRSSLYLLWLRARDGLRLRRPCPSHPARAQDAN